VLSRRALDGGAASLRPRMDWVVGPRYGRDMAEIWPRYGRDMAADALGGWVGRAVPHLGHTSAISRPYLG